MAAKFTFHVRISLFQNGRPPARLEKSRLTSVEPTADEILIAPSLWREGLKLRVQSESRKNLEFYRSKIEFRVRLGFGNKTQPTHNTCSTPLPLSLGGSFPLSFRCRFAA